MNWNLFQTEKELIEHVMFLHCAKVKPIISNKIDLLILSVRQVNVKLLCKHHLKYIFDEFSNNLSSVLLILVSKPYFIL